MRDSFEQLREQLKSVPQSAGRLARGSTREIEKAWDRLRDRRICLGVTGFSGSGKSTFLTSFIHQLVHFPNASLAAFSPVLHDRILGVELHVEDGGESISFDYQAGIQALSSSPPRWPEPTSGMSSMVLEIRYLPKSRLLKLPANNANRLFVEIRDYPGEWLLDLPLLTMSYSDWCYECSAMYSMEPRSSEASEFKQLLDSIDPFEAADELKLRRGSESFIACLHRIRESGLSLIQPGQFLLPGSHMAMEDAFFPLLNLPSKTDSRFSPSPENSYYNLMASRYQEYIDGHVMPFYKNSFSRINRQVVLVDLLGTLNRGMAAFEDMKTGLSQVFESFQYGQNSLLGRLFKPRIDKVVFAASKIDQALPEQHDNARKLMATVVYDAYRKARYQQVDTYCEAIASVRASSTRTRDGKDYLVGIDQEGAAGMMRHPDIPVCLPGADEWPVFGNWQLHTLSPPEDLGLTGGRELPHIRLDTVMRELLGDKFV